jgi:hypothetical protein
MPGEKILKGSYVWSAKEVSRAGVAHYRARNRWMGCWLAIILFIVATARLFLALMSHEPLSVEIGFVCLLLVIALFSLLLPLFVSLTIRLNFSRRPEQGKKVSLEVDGKKFIIDIEGLRTTAVEWETLNRIVQAREGLLCYVDAGTYHWLPFDAFTLEGREQLLVFAGHYAEKFKDIR